MKKQNYSKPILLFLALILSLLPLHSKAENAVSPNALATPPLGTQVAPSLITRIQEAKELLKTVTLNYQLTPVYTTAKKTKKKTLAGYNLGLRDLFVAILDPATNQISITGAMQNGKSFTFPDPNFVIKTVRFNGVNTRFEVNKPVGSKVLAIKYLITPIESGSKASIENSVYEATYVPYSPDIDTPEVAEYGAKYLDEVINKVAAELINYPSVSIPGKTVIEAINPALVKALVYAEHTDSSELLKSPDTLGVINKVKVLFGGNEGATYKYSGSSAGAMGISQFISSTYLGLVKRHPNANLIGDFRAGMEDHVNSIKATYLLLDDYIQGVKTRAGDNFIPGQAFDFGVAAYNGGTVRVAKALNSFGINWNSDQSAQMKASKQADVNSLASQVESLRKSTVAQKDKTKRAQMKKELDNLRSELASAKNELAKLDDATLRDETRGYLQKIYKVISHFNTQN